MEEPSANRLKLYTQLKKAESAVLIQARTGRIGLVYFLSKACIPGFESPAYKCKLGNKTAEHLLLYCQLESERRGWRRGATLSDLVSDPKNTAITARWIIQSGRLDQFRLASRLLYSSERVI